MLDTSNRTEHWKIIRAGNTKQLVQLLLKQIRVNEGEDLMWIGYHHDDGLEGGTTGIHLLTVLTTSRQHRVSIQQ